MNPLPPTKLLEDELTEAIRVCAALPDDETIGQLTGLVAHHESLEHRDQWLMHLDGDCNGPWLSLLLGAIIMRSDLDERFIKNTTKRKPEKTAHTKDARVHRDIEVLYQLMEALPLTNETRNLSLLFGSQNTQRSLMHYYQRFNSKYSDNREVNRLAEHDRQGIISALNGAVTAIKRLIAVTGNKSKISAPIRALHIELALTLNAVKLIPRNYSGEKTQRIQRELFALDCAVLYECLTNQQAGQTKPTQDAHAQDMTLQGPFPAMLRLLLNHVEQSTHRRGEVISESTLERVITAVRKVLATEPLFWSSDMPEPGQWWVEYDTARREARKLWDRSKPRQSKLQSLK